MNKKLVLGSLSFVLITGLITIYNKQSNQIPSVTPEGSPEADRAVLADKSADDNKTYEALHRLAVVGDPGAREAGLEKATAESRTVREGAANALGYFEDEESFKALMVMLEDKEENVRIRTLQALGNAKSEQRVEAVRKFLGRENLSDREVTIAHTMLIKMLPEGSDRTASISKLIEFAMKGDELEHYIAFSKLTELAPNDENVLKLIRYKTWVTKNMELKANGIRHLGASKDKWLNEKLEVFVKSEDADVRAAAILTMHQFCPQDRWRWLKEIAGSESQANVLNSLVREASILGGPEAKAIVDGVIASGKLNESEQTEAKKLLIKEAEFCK